MLKRVATAFLLIPAVVVLVLYAPSVLILAVVIVLTFLALLEYNRLTALIFKGHGSGILTSIAGLVITLCVYITGAAPSPLLFIAGLFIFLFTALGTTSEHRSAAEEAAFKTMGLVYISLPLSYFLLLAGAPGGRSWILFFLVLIWCNDSLAYVSGRAFGRHKLCPSISPGKTIEGALGGIACGIAAAFVFNALAPTPLTGSGGLVILAIVTGLLGIAGDLFESVIKRGAGVKDSGTIVPGHGGVLDRIDSMLFSLPAFYILAISLKI
ncbi:MAG: phosphatidate cytidylyltransferase [Thermodesulfobacteriota bacterium]